MARAFILLFDSFGVGATPDAEKFGDLGHNTLGHIAEGCLTGLGDNDKRQGPLNIPNLNRLGLTKAANQYAGKQLPGLDDNIEPTCAFGYAKELSFGKDTPSGHWEIAGVPALYEWGYFPPQYPSFPEALINELQEKTDIPGILGNSHASGTDIIQKYGDEHCQSGKPIIYTSADSVFQIACHEKHFGLDRLYEICEVSRKLIDPYNIGRVIARPFLGENGHYDRTANRRDYATPPHEPTLLNHIVDAGHQVIAIGKVADIYAHTGISQEIKADGNLALFDALLNATKTAPNNSLTFVNFVDFDSKYGHRRDLPGYAQALEELDQRLPEFEALLEKEDIAFITADHGCDPTAPGTDHTRECIPVLLFGPRIKKQALGLRDTFADIGQTIATHLNVKALKYGEALIK